MSIIQSDTDPKNVEAIIENIKELNGDEKELLWDWIQTKTLVGGQLIDIPINEDDGCKKCGETFLKDSYESLCYNCQTKLYKPKTPFNQNKCKDCSREIEFGNQCDRCQIGNRYA